jgi:hypothetical protein
MPDPASLSIIGAVTGIIGAIAGIAGFVLGYISYRRSQQIKALDLRLVANRLAGRQTFHPVSWLPYEWPVDDDRQISSKDQRSVKLRVRPSLTGTHRCHSSTIPAIRTS